MKIRFSVLIVFASSVLFTACSEPRATTYVPVPGYPAPRSIKLVEAEQSWKQKADRIMALSQVPAATKAVVAKKASKRLKVASLARAFSKQPRKLSSTKKSKLKLVAYQTRGRATGKVLPVW